MSKHGLGRALQHNSANNRFRRSNISSSSVAQRDKNSEANEVEVLAGLSSVTETNDLTEFLSRAELLGANFDAEKESFKLIAPGLASCVLSKAERLRKGKVHGELHSALKIPRRPVWFKDMSAEELDAAEKEAFLTWREAMALLENAEGLLMTPFEKNMEFWRQLWRVVERSDLIVQIVDARNPLFFYSEDLVQYVKEVDSQKKTAILVNKSDLLSERQITAWQNYFDSRGISVLFWSALVLDVGYLLSSEELVEALKELCPDKPTQTIGLVGYPNVGKSSTINTILKAKKVPVSATPGRTKHFQTLHLSSSLILCDCPGLVMPQFVYTKSDLVVSGVLPIDNMRDFMGPIQVLCERIPRAAFQHIYSLPLPPPDPDRIDQTQDLTAGELLSVYSRLHGFMTSKGYPHLDRAARLILKDYVNGEKITYCHPPPGCPDSPETFNPHLYSFSESVPPKSLPSQPPVTDFDKQFFLQREAGYGFRGAPGEKGKPDKKHHKKKDKLRRINRDLDIHP